MKAIIRIAPGFRSLARKKNNILANGSLDDRKLRINFQGIRIFKWSAYAA